MEQYDNPPIRHETTSKNIRIITQLTDCGHAGLLHVEIGATVKPKLIHAKPGESVTHALSAFSDAEVAALFGVQPVIFTVPGTMQRLVNHFFIGPNEQKAPLFLDEPGFVQWLAGQPLAECFASHQEAAEQLAEYETNSIYTEVMHHWRQFLTMLPKARPFYSASA